MKHHVIILFAFVISLLFTQAEAKRTVVADSITRQPLPGASVFGSRGNAIGIVDMNGKLPFIAAESYPITIRYLGFKEKTVDGLTIPDTVFLQENPAELPELIVETRRQKVLHMLAYVREYSSLTTYGDTVFLFREKMVDFMLPSDKKSSFKGWRNPRILTGKSYYRFTDSHGLDSVSDTGTYHFSWSDWMGIPPSFPLPLNINKSGFSTDTIHGKYRPSEIWNRSDSRVSADVNVLADTGARRWTPFLSGFFNKEIDFENVHLLFNYDNVIGDSVSASDLTSFSFNIDSTGRGHSMFRFNSKEEPYFVNTYGEVYILDKEYISVKDAKNWEKQGFDDEGLDIIEPPEAPELPESVRSLMARVDCLDSDEIRLGRTPDTRLMSRNSGKKGRDIGSRALSLLKQATGVTLYKSHKNRKRNWKRFKDEQLLRNGNK